MSVWAVFSAAGLREVPQVTKGRRSVRLQLNIRPPTFTACGFEVMSEFPISDACMLEVMCTYRGRVMSEPAVIFLFLVFFFTVSPSPCEAVRQTHSLREEKCFLCSCEYRQSVAGSQRSGSSVMNFTTSLSQITLPVHF